VTAILANPKYTGHMVFGRTRKTPGQRKARPMPPVLNGAQESRRAPGGHRPVPCFLNGAGYLRPAATGRPAAVHAA